MAELRAALASRGLPNDGLKADLANRLQARLDEEEFGMDEVTPPPPSTEESKKSETEAKEEAPPASASAPAETKEETKEEAAAPAETEAKDATDAKDENPL